MIVVEKKDVGPIVVSKKDVKYAKKDRKAARKEKLLENRLSQVKEAADATRKSFF